MATNYYEIADLATATLFSDKRKKASNIDPTLLRSYPYANKIVRQSVVVEESGKDIRFDANVAGADPADNYQAFQVFTRTVQDHLKQGTMQMRGTHKDFSFDIGEEIFNSGELQIINHVLNREQNAMIALTKKIEAQGWSNAAYADRNLVPQGFLYWLPYCSGDGDFVGTYPSGYSDVAGLDPNVYTGWKSYGGAYVDVTEPDLVLKMRYAMAKTRFMAPINPMLINDYSTGFQFAIYVNLDTLIELQDLAKLQNENLGLDLDPMKRPTMGGVPFTEVPTLGDNARDPVIGVNWGVTKHHVQRGFWMKRMKAPGSSTQPLVVTFDIFCQHQLVMYNRREGGFNLSKAA